MPSSRSRFRWESGYLRVGRIRDADLRLHWSLLIVAIVMIGIGSGVALIALVLLVLAHELGHFVLARRCGLAVYRIDITPIGGTCTFDATSATPWDRAVIAWGGVLAQLALFVPALIFVKLVPMPTGPVEHYLSQVLAVLLPLNLMMLLFNLVPMAPLDGHLAWGVVPMIPQRITHWRDLRAARRRRDERLAERHRSNVAGAARARGLRVIRSDDDSMR